jgi:hypothetical protein
VAQLFSLGIIAHAYENYSAITYIECVSDSL